MTSGTKVIGASSTQGYYYRKVWDGGDSPSVRLAPLPDEPLTSYYAWVKVGNGFERVLKYHRSRKKRPPKRARSKDPHNYTVEVRHGSQSAFQYHIKNQPAASWEDSWSKTEPPPSSLYTANQQISLVKRLKEEINGSGFDASVFLGTGHQSLTTITQSAIRIASAMRNVRKGNIGEALRDLRGKSYRGSNFRKPVNTQAEFADAWLGIQYGWRPLIQDVYESGSFLANLLEVPFQFKCRVHKRIQASGDVQSSIGFTQWMSPIYTEDVWLTAILTEPPSIFFKLGLTNPANLAWELLPWSFVIDWFVPVGDYLDARGASSSLVGSFMTSRVAKSGGTGLALSANAVSLYGIDSIRGASQCSTFALKMERTVGSSLPVPSPQFKSLSKIAGWQHCANSIALLVGVKSRLAAKW